MAVHQVTCVLDCLFTIPLSTVARAPRACHTGQQHLQQRRAG
jgi:hypothetical protein